MMTRHDFFGLGACCCDLSIASTVNGWCGACAVVLGSVQDVFITCVFVPLSVVFCHVWARCVVHEQRAHAR